MIKVVSARPQQFSGSVAEDRAGTEAKEDVRREGHDPGYIEALYPGIYCRVTMVTRARGLSGQQQTGCQQSSR